MANYRYVSIRTMTLFAMSNTERPAPRVRRMAKPQSVRVPTTTSLEVKNEVSFRPWRPESRNSNASSEKLKPESRLQSVYMNEKTMINRKIRPTIALLLPRTTQSAKRRLDSERRLILMPLFLISGFCEYPTAESVINI